MRIEKVDWDIWFGGITWLESRILSKFPRIRCPNPLSRFSSSYPVVWSFFPSLNSELPIINQFFKQSCFCLINWLMLARGSFDLLTSGLWVQHASTEPSCLLKQITLSVALFIHFYYSLRQKLVVFILRNNIGYIDHLYWNTLQK